MTTPLLCSSEHLLGAGAADLESRPGFQSTTTCSHGTGSRLALETHRPLGPVLFGCSCPGPSQQSLPDRPAGPGQPHTAARPGVQKLLPGPQRRSRGLVGGEQLQPQNRRSPSVAHLSSGAQGGEALAGSQEIEGHAWGAPVKCGAPSLLFPPASSNNFPGKWRGCADSG